MNSELQVSDALVRALGWALAHSLWQATVMALLLLILMPRLQTARQRYWMAYGALVTVFVAVLVTFAWSYEPAQNVPGAAVSIVEEQVEGSFFFVENETFSTSLWQTFATWLEGNHSLVVALWLVGFAFFLLRLGGGLWEVQRLRTTGTTKPEVMWQESFSRLQQRLGLSGTVALLESALVQTPMAIGWLKPVVLMPIGLVNRLSVPEVEAILAHELAHIARRDWIFNLLQAFIESLFYYHPAVWWISSVVRRERENCCDDAALAATGNPLAFAKALVQVQELAIPVPALALGLSGPRRRPLLDRVRRILNQPQQRQHQVMEKITATIILLAFLALVGLKANSVPTLEAAFSQISNIPTALFGGGEEDFQMDSDSLPKPKNTRKITREDDNQRVEAEYKDGKLTRLNIDGKEIPAAEFEQHEELIAELSVEAPAAPREGFWFSGFPESPEAPEAPEAPEHPERWEFPEPAEAPTPPFPPSFGGPIRVISDKDGEGNTVIRLDNNGDATEVVVKNGEVYVNGKKLEKGEALDIAGLSFGPGDASGFGFSFSDAPAIGEHERFYFGNPAEARELYFEHFYPQKSEEMARALAEHQRDFEINRKDYEREMKRAEKDMKRNQKEWEKEQKAWEKEQKTWEREQKKWEIEQKEWEKEHAKWELEHRAMEEKHKAVEAVIKKELLKDGLITNPDDFSLQLNDKVLKVNKKTQSEELRKKYIELFESMTGQKLNGKGSYFYNFSNED